MKIGGIQTLTLIDYPGKVAATVFTLGCNFRCHFCHNPELVNIKKKSWTMSSAKVFEFLKSRGQFLDGVCITGGEPTIHADFLNFLSKIKALGLAVKLDTNGLNFPALKRAIDHQLVDYVAMDIKAPWEKYPVIVGEPIEVEPVKKSAEYLMNSGVEYEFRSTVLPALHPPADIIEMARQIKGAKKYYLQQFKPFAKIVNDDYRQAKSYTRQDLIKIKNKIKNWFDTVRIRENI
ncbi:MAG: anaerobic ribonucleoside-triphosphate reductase activating protein [Patescibacteria group bacterium]